jgi:superfamily I DNA/RNA helicase
MDTYETVRPDDVDELRAMYEVFKIDPTPTRTVIELAQSSPKVFFTTLHGSKGLEFATVLVVGLDIVHERAATRKEDERLAYVAVTRAKSKLWLLLERENSSIAKWLNQHPIEGLNYWQLEGGALGYMTDSGTYLRNK